MGHAKEETRALTPFERTVKEIVAGIPKGTVLAYGEVALLAGRPGGARAVVRALHAISGTLVAGGAVRPDPGRGDRLETGRAAPEGGRAGGGSKDRRDCALAVEGITRLSLGRGRCWQDMEGP